jgi:ClpP class serine protease
MSRLIDFSKPYLMEPSAARTYLAIYRDVLARKAAGEPLQPEGEERRRALATSPSHRSIQNLEKRGGSRVPTGRLNRWGEPVYSNWYLRDGVGTLDLIGPITRYGSYFMSGGSDTEQLARDFDEMLNHADVESMILNFDTPGGSATSIAEFAAQIYAARGQKRMVAYGDGYVCSAGCWLAVACDEVVLSETAFMGSIGTIMGWLDDREQLAMEGLTEIEFISSQSPLKNPDPLTKSGKEAYQRQVDDLTKVFGEAVAKYRGTTTEDVFTNYGRGGIMIGARAVTAGMADRLGDYESLHAELSGRASTRIAFSTISNRSAAPTARAFKGAVMKTEVEEQIDEESDVAGVAADDDAVSDDDAAGTDGDESTGTDDTETDESADGAEPDASAKEVADLRAQLAQAETRLQAHAKSEAQTARSKFIASVSRRVPKCAQKNALALYDAAQNGGAKASHVDAFFTAMPVNEAFTQVETDGEALSPVASPVPPDPDAKTVAAAEKYAEKQNKRKR